MTEDIKIGRIYQHYKGKDRLYQVTGIAIDSETLNEDIIYSQLYNSKKFPIHTLWTRPKSSFLEKIVLDGKEVPRFKLVK